MPFTPLEQHLYDIGQWVSKKFHLHVDSFKHDNRQILEGEVWQCNLGYNVGQEKNKERPVLVISNNNINKTGKVVVVCITDTAGKMNKFDKPQQNSWMLLYSTTTDSTKMYKPGRKVPRSANSYSFLNKDSIVQSEEIRSVSKVRLITKLGCLYSDDLTIFKRKLKNAFNIS